ncbi:hypothetical protein BVG19_g3462 [[Candida] boidinii]|nr:hypothetical protein BVG19_g3462 [[Candida] boidinii]OWB52034.1 hypothetical protein B5S27_g3605 [[Candida] boidinii]
MSAIAFKLGTLLIRQASRPIANVLKSEAKKYNAFKHGCVRIAQSLHFFDSKLRARLIGQKNVKVRPLNEAKAVEDGAEFMAQTFIFGVAGSLIIYETYRQRQKEIGRREAVADDIAMLQEEIQHLKEKLKQYHLEIEEYHAPASYKPSVLKVDKDGVVVGVETKDGELDVINTKEDLKNREIAVKEADLILHSNKIQDHLHGKLIEKFEKIGKTEKFEKDEKIEKIEKKN